MVNRYLKLNVEQAYEIRRDIKSSVDSFYNLSQKINAYKLLRNRESILKNKLKVSFTSLKSKISLMESTLPEEERKNIEYEMMQKSRQERKINPPIQRPSPAFHPAPHPSPPPMHQIDQSHMQRVNPINQNHIPRPVKREPVRDISEDLEEIRRKLARFK